MRDDDYMDLNFVIASLVSGTDDMLDLAKAQRIAEKQLGISTDRGHHASNLAINHCKKQEVNNGQSSSPHWRVRRGIQENSLRGDRLLAPAALPWTIPRGFQRRNMGFKMNYSGGGLLVATNDISGRLTILLGKRIHSPGAGKWSFPGGEGRDHALEVRAELA